VDINNTLIEQVMTQNPQVITSNKLAAEALKLMQDKSITSIVVVDDNHCPIGALNIHDLLKPGVV
jgi:arabinose-5-phosphate isomerase